MGTEGNTKKENPHRQTDGRLE